MLNLSYAQNDVDTDIDNNDNIFPFHIKMVNAKTDRNNQPFLFGLYSVKIWLNSTCAEQTCSANG